MTPDIGVDPDTLSTSVVLQILDVVERFQAAWIAGAAPRIELFLGKLRGVERRALLHDLLKLEIALLLENGETPNREAYQSRFPRDSMLIDAVWIESGLEVVTSDFVGKTSLDGATVDMPAVPGETNTQNERPDSDTIWPEAASSPYPQWIGRYHVEELLGEGGYGRVYRAFDAELIRRVAVKVPHARRISKTGDIEAYLSEARIVAGLDHQGIVPVYDFGRTDDGLCFIVSKYLEGGDLCRRMRQGRPTHREAVEFLASIADAVQYAHDHGLVHRDIKPRNLLLDLAGNPHLADFGSALRDVDFGTGPTFAGTPYYMSPEQARGEGHLVNGRSDLFSLGVIFYEMLTGERPFLAASRRETIELIKGHEPRPPRHLDESIPLELERICLKALCKRVSERYQTATELAEDLRRFLANSDESADVPASARSLVPKGPRSFEADDSESFLRLLPGTRDRDGLPLNLGFWLGRITGPDEPEPLRVGLVYGPSGSGKSSFVKAGLLPRLPRRVIPLLVEATPEGLEARLMSELRRRFPKLPGETDLPGMLAAIRVGNILDQGHQLLIVLDQFEQRLHAKDESDFSTLVSTLRQSDGRRIRSLLIVRDDFWMSITRFFRELDIPLVEGKNSLAVDLFEPRHARRILEEFGRGFETLPARPAALSAQQSSFLDGAIDGLARNGKVIPVQLSLFAEMVKDKTWTPSTLVALGGADGVGVAFLEETFDVDAAPIEHRQHQRAARAILETLLPGPGANIKGSTRSRTELLQVSGYVSRPDDFDELEQILDQKLRLITPIDHGGSGDEPTELRYQLSHDYLVPSLREWLTRKLRETRSGRAEYRLSERTQLWSDRRDRKQLPSFLEWMNIRLFTNSARWDARELSMMRVADRNYLARILLTIVLISCFGYLGFDRYGVIQSESLRDRLDTAAPANLPGIIEQMGPYRRWVNPWLRDSVAGSAPRSREALRARLALLPVDPGQVIPLADAVLDADPEDLRVILKALESHGASIVEVYWKLCADEGTRGDQRVRAACALASFAPGDPRWDAVAGDIVEALAAQDLMTFVRFSELLRPVRKSLLEPLMSYYERHQVDPKGDIAIVLLAELAFDRTDLLLELILTSEQRQLGVITDKVRSRGDATVSEVAEKLVRIARGEVIDDPGPRRPVDPGKPEDERGRQASRRARAAMALTTLGHCPSFWPLLKLSQDPRTRTDLIIWMGRFGLEPEESIRQLRIEKDSSIRQALILGLGGFEEYVLPQSHRESLATELLTIYRNDPDPGIHSAIEWLLDRWGLKSRLEALVAEFRETAKISRNRRWFVNRQGGTMVVVPGPYEFLMGSLPEDKNRDEAKEEPHVRRIERTFAIGSKEVTVRQFLEAFPKHEQVYDKSFAPTIDCPINRITWFDAARYCRWLSELEKIPETEMCYPKLDQIVPGMVMLPGYLKRTGYRLPTEAEWEASARAGTITAQFYGSDSSVETLKLHSWNFHNSDKLMHPVGRMLPNPFGLFDVLGNAYEFCHDQYEDYSPTRNGPTIDIELPGETIEASSRRVLRGGAFHRSQDTMRSGARHSIAASGTAERYELVGFRVARTIRLEP